MRQPLSHQAKADSIGIVAIAAAGQRFSRVFQISQLSLNLSCKDALLSNL